MSCKAPRMAKPRAKPEACKGEGPRRHNGPPPPDLEAKTSTVIWPKGRSFIGCTWTPISAISSTLAAIRTGFRRVRPSRV